jgi:N-acetylneuraminic acid mutarotase
VHDVAGVVVGGRLLAVGGGASTESAAVQRVGPSSSQVGSLPSPRADLAAASTPRGVVVVGGYDGSSMPRDVLVSSDGTRWRTAGRLAVGVRYPAVVLDGTTLWVVGGERNGAPVDTIQALDLRTGRSRVTAHLPHALGHACAGLLAGRVVLAGGRTAGGVTDRVVWLDPATGATTPAGRLPRPLADAAAVPVGGDLLLVGGESPRVTDHVLRLHA